MSHNAHSRRPIIVAAPFSPEGGELQHLGAANKIRSVIRMLSKSGRRIILLNSAHNAVRFSRGRRETVVIGGVEVDSRTPFTLPVRPLGKLFNLLASAHFGRVLKRENPALVWVYNGYAFDAATALKISAGSDCGVVLQLEDWPTSRQRGLNPKPAIDFLFFRKILRKADLCTCINEPVAKYLEGERKDCFLLPGIISDELVSRAAKVRPFAGDGFTLGYFGGLSSEKGADVVLSLAKKLPERWNLVVCGSGTLRNDFIAASARESRVRFAENLSESQLYDLMAECDAVVNPHRSIADMKNGVFPYKVFEALAAKKLLISTPLPPCGVELNGVLWFDGTVESLAAALIDAPRHFANAHSVMDSMAAEITSRFSEEATYDALQARLPALARIDSAIGPYSRS